MKPFADQMYATNGDVHVSLWEYNPEAGCWGYYEVFKSLLGSFTLKETTSLRYFKSTLGESPWGQGSIDWTANDESHEVGPNKTRSKDTRAREHSNSNLWRPNTCTKDQARQFREFSIWRAPHFYQNVSEVLISADDVIWQNKQLRW